jgi:hypothetical protein
MTARYSLRIVHLDEARNQIDELGGATWLTKRERDSQFDLIPDAGKHTGYLVDVLDPNDSIIADRRITREVAFKLLGR